MHSKTAMSYKVMARHVNGFNYVNKRRKVADRIVKDIGLYEDYVMYQNIITDKLFSLTNKHYD